MFGWIMIGCAVVSIARIAEFEDLPVWPWALATAAAVLLVPMVLPWGLLSIFLAWGAMIVAMTLWNAFVGRPV